MQDVGLGDLAWILAIIVLVSAFWLEIPQRLARWFVARYAGRASFVGDVLSNPGGAESRSSGASTGAADPVLGQQHQAAPAPVLDFEAIKTYLKQHNVSDDQAIDLLALLRQSNGDVYLSANKIVDTVGGNEATVKARVAALRPKPPAPKPAAHLERPVNGW